MSLDTQSATIDKPSGENEDVLRTVTKLTPLELNNIKMDVRHTVLTPDYLEKLTESGQQS